MHRASLRTRLLWAAAFVAFLAVLATGLATYSAVSNFLYGQVDQSLVSAQLSLATALSGGEPVSLQVVGRLAPGMFVQVRSPANVILGTVMAESAGGIAVAPALPRQIPLSRQARATLSQGILLTEPASTTGGPLFRVLVSPLVGGGQLILGYPLTAVTHTLRHLESVVVAVAAVALAGGALLGWWLVGLGLRPLSDMERTTAAIASGELDERVQEGPPTTELGHLARSFNAMLDRIQEAFHRRDETEERLRRFVADASHELRTPVAAIAAYAELFERGADQRPEDLGRVLQGIRSEAARMTRLVEDLLLLARLDEGRPLETVPVELVALAVEAADTSRAVGPEWPVDISARRPVEVLGDPVRLRQVVDNLLGNVRAHTPPGTHARVSVGEDGDWGVVTVTDDGPGLSDEQLAHVFQRFYRADPSRSRHTGGAGLGLAIVRAIVSALGGTVAVARAPEGGLSVTVRLKRAPEAAP
jgi:two-component system OmpR family sensor kinase